MRCEMFASLLFSFSFIGWCAQRLMLTLFFFFLLVFSPTPKKHGTQTQTPTRRRYGCVIASLFTECLPDD
jgi:hypothetical protein